MQKVSHSDFVKFIDELRGYAELRADTAPSGKATKWRIAGGKLTGVIAAESRTFKLPCPHEPGKTTTHYFVDYDLLK